MFPLIEPQLHVMVEVSPVALECRHTVGTSFTDPGGGLAPASHRVQRYGRPLDREQVRQVGDVPGLVPPVPAELLAEDGRCAGRRTPRRPAVDGDGRALDPSGQPGRPPGERHAGLPGIERPEHRYMGVVGGDSTPERCRSAQEFRPFPAVEGDIDETFTPRHDAAEDRKQDLVERLHHLRLLSRVGDGLGMILKGCGVFHERAPPCMVSG